MAEEQILGSETTEVQINQVENTEAKLDDVLDNIFDKSEHEPKEQNEQEEQAQVIEETKLEAPTFLQTEEEKLAWSKTSLEAQELFTRKLEELQKSNAEVNNFAYTMQPIAQTIGVDLQDYFARLVSSNGEQIGGKPALIAQEIKDVLNTKSLLINDPENGLRTMIDWASNFGIDFSAIIQKIANEQNNYTDPELKGVMERQRMLEQRLREQDKAKNLEKQQAEQQRFIQDLGTKVSDFSADKASYEHLHGNFASQVGAEMGLYMRSHLTNGQTINKNLFDKAYKVAINSIDALAHSEAEKLASSKLMAKTNAGARAEQAAGINPKKKAGASQNNADLDDVLGSIFDKFQGA